MIFQDGGSDIFNEYSTAPPQSSTQNQSLLPGNKPDHTRHDEHYNPTGTSNFFTEILISTMSEKILSLKNELKTIWVQGIEDGGIAYVNKRPDLYRIYLLGDGKLVELAEKVTTAIVYLPKENKFLIMISARVANAVEFATEFKGNSDKDLSAIWDNIDRQVEQVPELIVIKIKDN